MVFHKEMYLGCQCETFASDDSTISWAVKMSQLQAVAYTLTYTLN